MPALDLALSTVQNVIIPSSRLTIVKQWHTTSTTVDVDRWNTWICIANASAGLIKLQNYFWVDPEQVVGEITVPPNSYSCLINLLDDQEAVDISSYRPSFTADGDFVFGLQTLYGIGDQLDDTVYVNAKTFNFRTLFPNLYTQ